MHVAYVRPYLNEKEIVKQALNGHVVSFVNAVEELDESSRLDVTVLSVFVDYPVTPQIMAILPALQLIAVRSVGYDHVAIAAAHERGIKVVRVPSYGTQTVAEFTFALVFMLSRRAHIAATDFAQTRTIAARDRYTGFDLVGKTLGVVGTGRIGQRVCAIGKGIGMNVVAYDPVEQPTVADLGVLYHPLETLLATSDIVSLHVPSLPTTHHLLNSERLALMKNTAYLVNTARGEVVDTAALVVALTSHRIAGAALDVLEDEPLTFPKDTAVVDAVVSPEAQRRLNVTQQLLTLPNVIVTPHIAFNTIEAKREITDITIKNILGFSRGDYSNEVLI